VVEWQTRRTQNPVGETLCGFKSHLRHHLITNQDISQSYLVTPKSRAAVGIFLADGLSAVVWPEQLNS
jgi:hypothetical protein